MIHGIEQLLLINKVEFIRNCFSTSVILRNITKFIKSVKNRKFDLLSLSLLGMLLCSTCIKNYFLTPIHQAIAFTIIENTTKKRKTDFPLFSSFSSQTVQKRHFSEEVFIRLYTYIQLNSLCSWIFGNKKFNIKNFH